MSDIVERLRSVIAGDYDTHGTLSMGGRTICDVPLIRAASDLAEMCHAAAAEIERLRAIVGAVATDVADAECLTHDELAEAIERALRGEGSRIDRAIAKERDALRAEVERKDAALRDVAAWMAAKDGDDPLGDGPPLILRVRAALSAAPEPSR